MNNNSQLCIIKSNNIKNKNNNHLNGASCMFAVDDGYNYVCGLWKID